MRILMLGDTHGDRGAIKYAHEICKSEGINTVMQVGDFGYWPGEHGHDTFTEYVSRKATPLGVTWYWLDGNHENFDALEKNVDMTSRVPVSIRVGFGYQELDFPNVFYCPRGSTWIWDGVTFMAMGGAYSVDKEYRTPHVSWWPQERITLDDVDRAKKTDKVDVLLCHDAPEGACPIIGQGSDGAVGWGYKAGALSQANRLMLGEVIDAVNPKTIIHGHMHHRYDAQLFAGTHPDGYPRWRDVHGLGRDGQRRDSWSIYNTEKRALEWNGRPERV